jgi:hypothetical protein
MWSSSPRPPGAYSINHAITRDPRRDVREPGVLAPVASEPADVPADAEATVGSCHAGVVRDAGTDPATTHMARANSSPDPVATTAARTGPRHTAREATGITNPSDGTPPPHRTRGAPATGNSLKGGYLDVNRTADVANRRTPKAQ